MGQLMKFKTIEEAIQRANSLEYGLAAGVCSTNIAKAMGIARRLQNGTVWINMYDDFDAASPFGGYKASGWGREKSEYALENFRRSRRSTFPSQTMRLEASFAAGVCFLLCRSEGAQVSFVG